MSDQFAEQLAKMVKEPHGGVMASHLATQLAHLDRVYENESTREAAYILAKDWVENGNDLRKAAVAAWAKDKKIPVGDAPDPLARKPTPADLSNGQDAPDSAAGAATVSSAEAKPASKEAPQQAVKKPAGDVYSRLRAMKARRGGPSARADDPITAAYEAGHRDATAKHADHAHRVSRMASRHAFALGADAGHAMATKEAGAANAERALVPVRQQVEITQPGIVKTDLAGLLMKAYDETKHAREYDGKFAHKNAQRGGEFIGGGIGALTGAAVGSALAHRFKVPVGPAAGLGALGVGSIGAAAGGAVGAGIDSHFRKKRAIKAGKLEQYLRLNRKNSVLPNTHRQMIGTAKRSGHAAVRLQAAHKAIAAANGG